MPLEIPCPQCGAVLRAPDGSEGRKARCKKCQHSFRLPGDAKDAGDQSQALSVVDVPAFDFEAPPAAPKAARESKAKPAAKASTAKASMSKRGYQRREANGSKMPLVIALGVLLAAGLGAAAYFLNNKDDKKPQAAADKNEPAKDKDKKKEPTPAAKAEEQAEPVKEPEAAAKPKAEKAKARPRAEGGLELPDPPEKAGDAKPHEQAWKVEVPFEKVRAIFAASKGEAPVTAVLALGDAGIGGEGAKDNLLLYNQDGALTDTVPVDGGPWPRPCDFSPKGERFAGEGPPGTVAVYDLVKKAKIGEGFKPFAEMVPPPAIVAVLFADEDRVLVAGADGKLELWKDGKKAMGGSLGGVIEPGCIARNAQGNSFAAVCNGSLVKVPAETLVASSSRELPNKPSKCYAVSGVGDRDRVAIVYDAEDPALHARLAILPFDGGKVVTQPLGESFGTPVSVGWNGIDSVSIATDRRNVTAAFHAERGELLGALWPTDGKALRLFHEGKLFTLVPAAEAGQCLLLPRLPFPKPRKADLLELEGPKKAKFEPMLLGPQGLSSVK